MTINTKHLLSMPDDIILHYDDSSDEEDIKQKRQQFKTDNTESAQQSLKPKLLNGGKDMPDHFIKLSFLTHNMGQEILYSNPVNKAYLKLKQDTLKNAFTQEIAQNILEAIEHSIQYAVENIFIDFSSLNKAKYNEIRNHVVQDFYKCNKEPLNQLTLKLYRNLRTVLSYSTRNVFTKEILENIYNELIELAQEYIENKKQRFTEYNDNQKKQFVDLYIKLENIPQAENLDTKKQDDWDTLKTVVTKKIDEICIQNGLYTATYRLKKGKEKDDSLQRLNTLIFKVTLGEIPPTFNPVQEFYTLAQHIHTYYSATDNVNRNDFINNNIGRFTGAYYQDLIRLEEGNAIDLDGNDKKLNMLHWNESRFFQNDQLWKSILDTSIPVHYDNIWNMIKDNISRLSEDSYGFQNYFYEALKNIEKQVFERTILPQQYEFKYTEDKYNIIQFLANLRLCNRSVKREIRNRKNDSNILAIHNEVSHRSAVFPASSQAVLEKQKLYESDNRSDFVENAGSYLEVMDTISMIKTILNSDKDQNQAIQDCDIASWIRKIVQGDNLESLRYHKKNNQGIVNCHAKSLRQIKTCLTNITYLLFGVEVTRNPASLIHHQMMLDLIIGHHMSFTDCLYDIRDIFKKLRFKKKAKGSNILEERYTEQQIASYLINLSQGLNIETSVGKKVSNSLNRLYHSLYGSLYLKFDREKITQYLTSMTKVCGYLDAQNGFIPYNFNDYFFNNMATPLPMVLATDKQNDVGAVKCARNLHIAYSHHMIYPYKYPGDAADTSDDKLFEFIYREGYLVNIWFIRIGASNSEYVSTLSNEYIYNILQTFCKQWYGIDFIEKVRGAQLSEPEIELLSKQFSDKNTIQKTL